MSSVIKFIEVFRSPSNEFLFTQVACYWFAVILHQRFPNSSIVYDPHQVHFATKIGDKIYDITGIVEDTLDYLDWDSYSENSYDAYLILQECINLERR